MAQMRSVEQVRKCLLLGVDRTDRGHHETDAFDPSETSGLIRSEAGWMSFLTQGKTVGR
jgi:hypothetical protein